MIALRAKGTAENVSDCLVGRITFGGQPGPEAILLTSDPERLAGGQSHLATLTSLGRDQVRGATGPLITSLPLLNHLDEGDIVAVYPSGLVTTLFRAQSPHNTLFTTERCNSNCLMCSQPPKNVDDIGHYFSLNKRLLELMPDTVQELGVTGGEPTLMGPLFFELLRLAFHNLPRTQLHVLTNGRVFEDRDFVAHFQDLDTSRLVLGIPLYSDFDQSHDYVVQARGAFDQTLRGLYHLGERGIRVEIRVVVHKQTYARLPHLADYLYRNLPFVEHVALMGLEYVGYTPFNDALLWMEPSEYMAQLAEAAEFLDRGGINVSIYNQPLCLLPPTLWPYARRSISDWKQIYLPGCQGCTLLKECGGVFATSRKLSAHIQPFLPEHA